MAHTHIEERVRSVGEGRAEGGRVSRESETVFEDLAPLVMTGF